jgi:hypothetical protein
MEPSQVLTQMVAGELRQRLLGLAEGLEGTAGLRGTSQAGNPADPPPPEEPRGAPRNPAQGLPSLGGEDDDDEEVGIFTVFE